MRSRRLGTAIALVALQTTEQSPTRDALAYFERGRLAVNERNYGIAKALYDTMLMHDPRFALGYVERGGVRNLLGDTLGAMADYETAIRYDSTNHLAFHRRGMQRNRFGLPGGMEDISHAIQLQPGFSAAWFVRGSNRLRQGDREGGIADLREAARLGNKGAADRLVRLGVSADASPPATPRAPVVRPPPIVAPHASTDEKKTSFTGAEVAAVIRPYHYALVFVALVLLSVFLDRKIKSVDTRAIEKPPTVGDDKVLWVGVPQRGLVFRFKDVFAVIAGLVLVVLGSLQFLGGLLLPVGADHMLYGALFTLGGYYMALGRLFTDAWNRARTSYGVTMERAFIKVGEDRRSFPITKVDIAIKGERRDGRGTITFNTTASPEVWEKVSRLHIKRDRAQIEDLLGQRISEKFELIPDAARVLALIRRERRREV